MENDIDNANLTKIRTETSKLLADMEHDLSKRHNWAEQERHWKAQRIYWWILAVLGFIAVLINGFKPLWSS